MRGRGFSSCASFPRCVPGEDPVRWTQGRKYRTRTLPPLLPSVPEMFLDVFRLTCLDVVYSKGDAATEQGRSSPPCIHCTARRVSCGLPGTTHWLSSSTSRPHRHGSSTTVSPPSCPPVTFSSCSSGFFFLCNSRTNSLNLDSLDMLFTEMESWVGFRKFGGRNFRGGTFVVSKLGLGL